MYGVGPMSRARIAALLALAGCAKMPTAGASDAGASQPVVEDVEPPPGEVAPTARFTVRFSDAMDEGQLLAASGRSESVALATDADAERAAAAIEHAPLSAHERSLLLPAAAEVASDRRSIALAPDQPLAAGRYALLVSPRLKDEAGRKLAGNGMRFAFSVAAPESTARLITPPPGGEVPWNLGVVRAFAPSGHVAVVGPGGALASADAHGAVALALGGPLVPGTDYALALDGAPAAGQGFSAAACARTAAPALQGGAARLSARDTAVTIDFVLDWPARVDVSVEDARGTQVSAQAQVSCAPPPCGPQSFTCAGSIRIEGLIPASDYTLRVSATDDFGFALHGAPQAFSTLAALPRIMLSEVMAAGIDGEYAEILNLGPGAADLESLALRGADGIVRPLLGGVSPLPLALVPGARAIAAGASFDASLYPSLPAGTPVLRASTQRLLGRGLADDGPAPFSLVTRAQAPVELAVFPAPPLHCPAGASLQRDEALPADLAAPWVCGPPGGTPGRPP